MSDFKKNKDEEIDKFWDISSLVPAKPKKKIAPASPSPKTTPVTVLVNDENSGPNESHKLTLPKRREEEPEISATYENVSPFIPQVKIVNWKSTYNYYEFFCRQAAALYNKKGAPCEPVHFFSYVAQYSQLNRRQLEWYLWWRECVRNNKFLDVDISYIYLLVFEIINLGNAIDTKKSMETLIALWSHYKDTYPQLLSILGDWICDYSLIHNLPITFPDERIDQTMISSVSLKEALLSFDLSDRPLLSKFMMSFCNSYNYRKSKFYVEENKEAYDKYLPAAVAYFFERTDIEHFLAKQPKKHLSIVSFTGALCSYKIRKHIEVDYLSFCDSVELKGLIADIVKYSENKLRAFLGIRSRLTVSLKDERIKSCIDEYFAKTLSLNHDRSVPEYEKLYDVKETEFSLDSALDIELQSWDITQKLVEAFEEEPEPRSEPQIAESVVQAAPLSTSNTEEDPKSLFLQSISTHLPFFQLILKEDFSAQIQYVRENHLMSDAVVDEINTFAADLLGDILIEEEENGYRIIDDYKAMFESNI